MGSNVYSAALSGMNAAQFALTATEHNIANANTPGYTRQIVETASRAGQQTGAGFLGQGVDVSGVRRIYDQFISAQLLQEQSQASYLSTYHSALSQIDNLVADSTAGASPAMQQFFDAMNGVANNPESVPARQTLLSAAQFAVNRFTAIDQRLTDIASGVNSQIANTVNSINSYAQQIAILNGNIKRATAASSQGLMPNDLMDQRDQLINLLNKEIRATVQNQPDGTATVFVGSGQVLVIGEISSSLAAAQALNDPSKLEISYQSGTQRVAIPQSSLQGGNLGAYLTFRDQSLEPTRNALGRVALGLAESINQQSQMGLDMNGMLGGNMFVSAVPRVTPTSTNTGGAQLAATINNVAALTTSDYLLRFDGTNYTLQRMSDNVMTTLGPTLPQTSADGFTIDIAATSPGTPAAGDSFLIRPTADGAKNIALAINEPAKIAAAAPMRAVASLTNLGTAKIAGGMANAPLPLDPNLQAPVSITFDNPPNTFSVVGVGTGDPVGVPYVAGQDIVYNGWTVKITGNPAAGDVFTISPNLGGSGDNRNALLLAALQTKSILSNGTASVQSAYGQLVAEVGSKTHELSVTSTAQTNMLNETIKQQQSISGVNLDEEAANLMRYQRAYQAAAKAMQIANTIFDTLLSLGR